MAAFVGETVLVTLRYPNDAQVKGRVTDIVNQELTLKDVVWVASGQQSDYLVVNGPENLIDIEIVEPAVEPQPAHISSGSHALDPAILSYGRPGRGPVLEASITETIAPKNQATVDSSRPLPTTTTHNIRSGPSQPLKTPFAALVIPDQSSQSSDKPTSSQNHASTSATLTGPFSELTLGGQAGAEDEELSNSKNGQGNEPAPKKSKRRRQRKGTLKEVTAEPALKQAVPARIEILQREPQIPAQPAVKENTKPTSSGWRETPFLEEAPQSKQQSLHPLEASRRSKRRRRPKKSNIQDQNGWATEEATDIQDMGDFDFSGNLSKFDKRGVFNHFKQEDTTADEERLVTHNRLPPKPGTAGGKNLHYTENVLDSPKSEGPVDLNSSDSEHGRQEAKAGSDKSSRRGMSRASRTSIHQPRSRKSSVITSEQYMTGSGSLPESKPTARWTPRGSMDDISAQRDISSSRELARRTALHNDSTKSRLTNSTHSKPRFRLLANDQICPSLTPLQMLELEQLAVSELGMTDDILTENASRAIAETAIQLTSSGDHTASAGKRNMSPTIVCLAGNTKSGARAVGGARHLLNHGAKVFVTVLGFERQDDLLDAVRRQISIFCNCGGQVTRPDRLMKALHNGRARADLIVDALLGMHMTFDDMRTDDQAMYFGLATWANKDAPVLAVDVPSGLDASSGVATVVDGTELVIHADSVLFLGAPKTGLLAALGNIETSEHSKLFVADIGISNTVWRKFGIRSRNGIDYEGEWVAGLRYQPSGEGFD